MNKKFISAIMAGAMAVSALGMSVSAAVTPNKQEDAEYGTKAQSYKIAAAVTAPEMKVTLPATVAAVINPYNVSVKINEEAVAAKNGVLSPIYTITNNTTDLGIKVKATASASSDTVKILDAKPSGVDLTDADALTYTETGDKPSAYAEVYAGAGTSATLASVGTGKEVIFKDSTATGYTATPVGLMELKPGTASAGEKGYFQITGAVSNKITVDSNAVEYAWSKEKINYVLVLDITPANITASAVGNS